MGASYHHAGGTFNISRRASDAEHGSLFCPASPRRARLDRHPRHIDSCIPVGELLDCLSRWTCQRGRAGGSPTPPRTPTSRWLARSHPPGAPWPAVARAERGRRAPPLKSNVDAQDVLILPLASKTPHPTGMFRLSRGFPAPRKGSSLFPLPCLAPTDCRYTVCPPPVPGSWRDLGQGPACRSGT